MRDFYLVLGAGLVLSFFGFLSGFGGWLVPLTIQVATMPLFLPRVLPAQPTQNLECILLLGEAAEQVEFVVLTILK
jgi:hypothetical protein